MKQLYENNLQCKIKIHKNNLEIISNFGPIENHDANYH